MPTQDRLIFVSYSRVDGGLVTPLVKVLRTIGGRIFQDTDSISPGMRWRTVIQDTLEAAWMVLVFWCEHSNESAEVRAEWMTALSAKKQ